MKLIVYICLQLFVYIFLLFLCRLTGTGRTDLMRRVSRASRRTTPTATPKVNPKNRKTSIEEAVKHTTEVVKNVNKQLTDLAVTISADENLSDETSITVPLKDKKLKRTNLMTRRESQACLERTEGVRKNKLNGNVDSA